MKRNVALAAVAALALLSTVQAGFYFTVEDLESDADLWELYGRWAAHHQVVREPSRFATFKANAIRLHGKQRHAGELMALNIFGDQTLDEVMATSCLLQPEQEQMTGGNVQHLDLVAAMPKDRPLVLPNGVDWRETNAVTDVKNQGGCGCCWAFATAGAVEGLHAIKTKTSAFSLSAQFLLDCTYDFIDKKSSCSGGSRYMALTAIKNLGGIPADSDYNPYTGVKSTCDQNKFNMSANVSNWFTLKEFDVQNMKLAVSYQPVLASVGVDDDFLRWDLRTSSGPVYYGPGNTTLSHAMLVVGYDFDEQGDMYWIVKNSWGSEWGDDGYISISAAANVGSIGKEGVAGILTQPIYVQ